MEKNYDIELNLTPAPKKEIYDGAQATVFPWNRHFLSQAQRKPTANCTIRSDGKRATYSVSLEKRRNQWHTVSIRHEGIFFGERTNMR
jgi:sensor domain CHASE-containing protein